MTTKLVQVMNTAFRDGFQSCLGARVFWKDYKPAVEAAKAAGITHFEFGGGAMFQSAYFYCGQDAFTVMDEFRSTVGNDANLQTLARGINVVCLDSQPSDIIDLHARLFKKHGTTTIRNFDALNDVDNLVHSGNCIKKHGLYHEIVITMMALPPGCTGAHDAAFYVKTLRAILDKQILFDSLCFKDASGTATPQVVYDTIKACRALLGKNTPIRMHTHETAGVSVLVYKAALEAGADAIDLSMAPMSGGTCQPDIITMWHALRGTGYDLGIDPDKILEAESVFKECMAPYDLLPEDRLVEPLIPWSPMPGGALTANTQMLRDNGILDKFGDIIKAMSETVRRGGFGTSVTPVSQFYFQQAFNNVMFGPWNRIADGYGRMVLGYFGKTPVPPDPELVKICTEKLSLPPSTENPLVLNDRAPGKGLAAARAQLTAAGVIDLTDENLFIAAACGEKGVAFIKGDKPLGVRLKKPVAPSAGEAAGAANEGSWTVAVDGREYVVAIVGQKATLNGKIYEVSAKKTGASTTPAAASATVPKGKDETLLSPLPGKVVKVLYEAGDKLPDSAPVVVIEAMKMLTEIRAKGSGTLVRALVAPGDQVKTGQPLAIIAS